MGTVTCTRTSWLTPAACEETWKVFSYSLKLWPVSKFASLNAANVLKEPAWKSRCVHSHDHSDANRHAIPLFSDKLSPRHRFPLQTNDEPVLAGSRHTPNYCTGFIHWLIDITKYTNTDEGRRRRRRKNKSCITIATNPLIRTWSLLVFKRRDQCQAKVRK